MSYHKFPVDNFGTVVGENPTPYGILALWAVNGLSIVCWVCMYDCQGGNPIGKVLVILISIDKGAIIIYRWGPVEIQKLLALQF